MLLPRRHMPLRQPSRQPLCLSLPLAALQLGLLGLLGAGLAQAQGQSIYSCVTPDGRKLTADRPIAECASREQKVHNPDGSVRSVLPPSMSLEEKAAQEMKERKLAAERAAQQDAIRRDRNLMIRYRNEAAHREAREAALDDVTKAMQASERRIKELAAERKPLVDEAEFYKGKTLPPKLRQQLDANDVSSEAQHLLVENQKAELVRVNKVFDAELLRLKKLWAGAAPGSLDGPAPGPASTAHPATATSR
ncbi:MAG TPA: hypothetical protein VK195_11970 [Burkholderiaceae bacterium]|nr:hypothetical protein [Burkholderiaceae bacterium]